MNRLERNKTSCGHRKENETIIMAVFLVLNASEPQYMCTKFRHFF